MDPDPRALPPGTDADLAAADSMVAVLVVRSREELMVARAARTVLPAGQVP